jgi:hypothetical protein
MLAASGSTDTIAPGTAVATKRYPIYAHVASEFLDRNFAP